MEQTIDLRPYLAALGRYLWLIVGAAILAILASIAFYLLRDDYKAITLLTIPEPTQEVQFDPRLRTTIPTAQMISVYNELAKSSELMLLVLPHAQEVSGGRIDSEAQLRTALQVTSSANGRLLHLIATDPDPNVAAELSNIWAEEFIIRMETLFGRGGIGFYTKQLNEANDKLHLADDALVAFQTTNRQGIVDNELAALISRQQSLLAEVNKFQRVLADIQTLRTQLENNTTDSVTLADQLSALTVQLHAYETTLATPSAPQFQLNIGTDAQLTASQRADQLQQLDALRLSIEAALVESRAQQETLAAPIFALQTEKQQLFNEGERLLNAQAIAQETQLTIARKLDEERVASRDTIVRLASKASVPTKPTRPNLLVLASLFSIATLLPTIAFVVLLTWWRSTHQRAA